MTSNVTPIRPAPSNLSCPKCGSEWFKVRAVVLSTEMNPVGYAAPVECLECGHEVRP